MTTTRIVARSVSRQVQEWLSEGLRSARVLAVFERACNLATTDGEVIALVDSEIGDGPLNVVLEDITGFRGQVQPGAEIVCEVDRLVILRGDGGSSLQVDLREAALWEPRPNWDELRERQSQVLPGLDALRALCLAGGSSSILLPLLGEESLADAALVRKNVALERACQAALDLRAGWGWDGERRAGGTPLRRGAAALAGLGIGLTPAGDDFLVGTMLWAWLAHPAPRPFCQSLAEEAAPRTTKLSAAFLRAAARGQCSGAWQRLLRALPGGREADVVSAGWQVLGFGASSGADALIGFLFMSGPRIEAPGALRHLVRATR